MNKYIDEVKSDWQPRRPGGERGGPDSRFHLSKQELYDELKSRQKYSRSERKDLIRIAKKIYIQ